MNEQANVDVVQRLYEAFRHGDIPTVMSCLDPRADLVFEGPPAIPWAGTRHGRAGWEEFFKTVGASLDELTLTMEPFAAQGDKVVAAGRYQARVRATGKRIDSPLVHLWTVRDGLIQKCQELTNTAAEAAACTSGAKAASRTRV